MLRLVVPFEGKGVGVTVYGVGDGDHLMEICGEAGELGEVGLGHGAGGLAVVKIGAIGVVIEGSRRGDGCDIACRVFCLPGVFGGVAL